MELARFPELCFCILSNAVSHFFFFRDPKLLGREGGIEWHHGMGALLR
jgi:hypothetical protein